MPATEAGNPKAAPRLFRSLIHNTFVLEASDAARHALLRHLRHGARGEPDNARIIATSAQFVDDNVARSHVDFRDGSRLDQETTAHHPIDLSNRDDRDQRRVWVPFHFIPGNEGDDCTERLKCRMDSPIVRELRDHHLTYADRGFGLHLLGITAHVYADTFSHYGFSGVSSRGNKVDNSSFRFHEEVEEGDATTVP